LKICLFGGTFDPPHIGHLLIAQTVCEAEGFDKVIFIPANRSPSKKVATVQKNRVEMLELAVEGNPNFEISDLEIRRGGISYTIDTLRAFKDQIVSDDDEISFMVGSDSLLDFKNWKEAKEIIKMCNIIVAIRPGFRPSDIPSWLLHGIQFANIPRFEISSSNIRKRWIEDKTIRYMVTLPVWEYINKHNLYS
jgi:nicotinate-nucleotide adenylyltransferase|tara:strand:+ start:63 stop:641 length:579 start_codon:yes stop_codon:yes gene_type:complete